MVKLCAQHEVPIVPFGAGTSLEGHILSSPSGITLSLEKMDSVTSVSPSDLTCTVEPGVHRLALNSALGRDGLFFPVDPGADATIGGMCATNCSGTSAVRYGVMRTNVLALNVVTPQGDLIKVGSGAFKNSAGYSLKDLYVGSEGTLGVITSATLRLQPLPSHISAGVTSFETLEDACDAVLSILHHAIPVVKLELLDASSIVAFNSYNKSQNLPPQPHLFIELSDPTPTGLSSQQNLVTSILSSSSCTSTPSFSEDPAVIKTLWSARHSCYYASCSLRPESKGLVTDVCVPVSNLFALISETVKDVEDSGIVGPCFGHAGDGNFHCILPLLPDDPPEYVNKVKDVNKRLVERAIAMNGTCTGEHGVGTGKMEYLETQYGQGAVEVMRAVKKALDPSNIMNPNKIC